MLCRDRRARCLSKVFRIVCTSIFTLTKCLLAVGVRKQESPWPGRCRQAPKWTSLTSCFRAIYSHARYLLIDDALSALDAVSGHHVFTQALAGPLVQGRCVVLVTHHVKLCLSASNPTTVVDLQKGHATIREPEKSDSTVQDSEKTATPSPLDTDTPATLVDDKAPGHKFLSEETRQKGHVRWTVYKTYLYASGYALWVLMVALLMLSRGSRELLARSLKQPFTRACSRIRGKLGIEKLGTAPSLFFLLRLMVVVG